MQRRKRKPFSILRPHLDVLRQEYVLVQAWKKTADYIRRQGWYVDTLELDMTTANLTSFLAKLANHIDEPDEWESRPLRIIPAPKSQQWQVDPVTRMWEPQKAGPAGVPLRPLAHVSLRDQVAATAVMLCLANRIETAQGDPTGSRKLVTSYGNRLFCDVSDSQLRHRWGSRKSYRTYFEDYKTFVARPYVVAKSVQKSCGQRVFIVDSDLSQFYDRVRPEMLQKVLHRFKRTSDDPAFYRLVERIFDWRWDSRDLREVSTYKRATDLKDFERVALPQGLVSAGFFANAVLLDFDSALRQSMDSEIVPGIHLRDSCRYVDDLRIVVTADRGLDTDNIEHAMAGWLQALVNTHANGLCIAEEKTRVAEFDGSSRPYVRQSARMNRIQSAISGGFDPIAGAEILDGLQGLMRSQDAFSEERERGGWRFSPVADVGGQTVARFSAHRFRKTYRSMRPFLEDQVRSGIQDAETDVAAEAQPSGRLMSREELDHDARAFALDLIDRWVTNPSNIRLLLVGLDIWPDPEVLRGILDLLKPYVTPRRKRGTARRIAWYCLGELLRAGATETGVVSDEESLSSAIDLDGYRRLLGVEAARILGFGGTSIPWHLRQQALLYLAAFDPGAAPIVRRGRIQETRNYRELILFLRGDHVPSRSNRFAVYSILAFRAFSLDGDGLARVRSLLSPGRLRAIAELDLDFAYHLTFRDLRLVQDLPSDIRADLCLGTLNRLPDYRNLAEVVLSDRHSNGFRNELSILRFAELLLRKIRSMHYEGSIRPGQVQIKADMSDENDYEKGHVLDIAQLDLLPGNKGSNASLYAIPAWCDINNQWRFQLGFLLRFILTRRSDFTAFVPPFSVQSSSSMYSRLRSHWYQRLYGFFNGQQAFGDDWLPISDWTERFLAALLTWPGFRKIEAFEWVNSEIDTALEVISQRRAHVKQRWQGSRGDLFVPVAAQDPISLSSGFRACVVQTVVPTVCDFDKADPTFSDRAIRRKHRNHLASALAAVRRMIEFRRSHMQDDGRVDLLVLPELAVHPADVTGQLIPFAQANKTLILAGVTYERLSAMRSPVNSAIWIIPEMSKKLGFGTRIRRQGKRYLSPEEDGYKLRGFRPCQWIIEYPYVGSESPLRLTASVCYDATDLSLANDLRHRSDIFVIPAFNRDVKTFDQMAIALHYHMFQLIVVANNGEYGGSSAYWPLHGEVNRQLFHLHGQPQVAVAFLEIKHIDEFLSRGDYKASMGSAESSSIWKYPPAGW